MTNGSQQRQTENGVKTMKHLGKIASVTFGHVGYQGAMLGISFSFSFDECCGVSDSKCAWDAEMIECSDRNKWTEEDRSQKYDEIMRFVSKLLSDAKVSDVNDLSGKPVELEFDGESCLGSTLKAWRILTEVI
jgi:hypothetical protein